MYVLDNREINVLVEIAVACLTWVLMFHIVVIGEM